MWPVDGLCPWNSRSCDDEVPSLVLASSISISQAKHLFPAIGFVRRADDIAHFVAVTTPWRPANSDTWQIHFRASRPSTPGRPAYDPQDRRDPMT